MAIERINKFAPADRYLYDFRAYTYAKGWAQIDTKQDACYYGTGLSQVLGSGDKRVSSRPFLERGWASGLDLEVGENRG